MIRFRDRMARGRTRTGWLDSRHTFSFGSFHDPAEMGFRSLRVINEDRVIPGAGFPTHGHRDMEIVTYVLEGKLQHKDSLGTGSVIAPGEIQRMSAGTGIMHSEFNASSTEPVHFLQIWILPARTGTPPGYEQRTFGPEVEQGQLVRAPIALQQDAAIYVARLDDGATVAHALAPGRGAWLQIARGVVALNGTEMKEGDGAAIEAEPTLEIEATAAAEVLVFDLG
ncbi:MAG TPA: pirin family protein [Stellaceae bacterium]|nr:pirin family protein [Stellaceae bacterium]